MIIQNRNIAEYNEWLLYLKLILVCIPISSHQIFKPKFVCLENEIHKKIILN